jgi:hypothetical protein
MKHRKRDVIAAKRNNKKVLVYIPEKIRRSGKRYVQQYKLIAMRPYAEPMIVSINDTVFIYANISSTSITISAPFSRKLLNTYMRKIAAVMPQSRSLIYVVKDLATSSPSGERGSERERDSEAETLDFFSGNAGVIPM